MIKCSACENCGNFAIGVNIYCPVCGKIRYAKPEINDKDIANFIGRVKLRCSNCIYCRFDGGTGTSYICLNYTDGENIFGNYRIVKPYDLCNRFIPNEAIENK